MATAPGEDGCQWTVAVGRGLAGPSSLMAELHQSKKLDHRIEPAQPLENEGSAGLEFINVPGLLG